jgi:MEMO1 family protein
VSENIQALRGSLGLRFRLSYNRIIMAILLNAPIPPFRQDMEIDPIEHEGHPMFVVSDALGLREESVLVSPSVVMIAALLDGKRRVSDVRAELVKNRMLVSDEEIQRVVDELDRLGLLETEGAQELRLRALEAFRQSPARPLVKTRGWPEDPLGMGAFLGRFYEDAKGPGPAPAPNSSLKTLRGVVAPHIDFFRGGPLYAWAYAELAKRPAPDVIVALGVAHAGPRSPWVMTRKAYETPFGPLSVDETLYDEIRGQLWYDPRDEEWVHAKEHSLEFQAVWLKYIWRQETPAWVPILCSSYERFCQDRPPSAIPTLEAAVAGVGKILAARAAAGQRVMVLAGVDFAHVGRRFGDDMDVTPELQQKVEAADRASLEKLLALDADGFFMDGVGGGAWRKVCGLSALYTAARWIKALPGSPGAGRRLLAYDQAPDPAGGIVSFASAAFD